MGDPISVTTVAEGVARIQWQGEPSVDELRREVAAALGEQFDLTL